MENQNFNIPQQSPAGGSRPLSPGMKKPVILLAFALALGLAAFAFLAPQSDVVVETESVSSTERALEAPAQANPAVSLAAKGVVSVATLGSDKFVVDANGYTLYANSGDELSGTKAPMCDKACETTWLPYYFDSSLSYAASSDPLLKRLNIFTRADGRQQYALGNKPLYRYVGDKRVGDRFGFGNGWSMVTP